MKKLLIVCILAIGMMANAQAPQLIAKPLKLTSVVKGTAADSVLVLGADKIMKFVPRSAFGRFTQVNPDWNAVSGPSEILNKPFILNGYQDGAKSNMGVGASEILSKTTTGDYNIGFGDGTLPFTTTGVQNAAFGSYALYSNTTGSYNLAMGISALQNNTTGIANIGIGGYSQYSCVSGSYNLAIGGSALYSNVYGTQNIAIGGSALKSNIGTNGSNVFGHRSIAIGTSAMQNNTTGNGIAIGNLALGSQTIGTWNIGIGMQAGSGITTGSNNVVIAGTGFILAGGGITTGSNNLIVAQNNGNTTGVTTGSGNTIIGKVTGLAAGLTNNVVLADGVGTIRAQHDGTSWLMNTPIKTTKYNLSTLNTAPTSATDVGTLGEIRYTASHIYVCIATNTWVRSPLTTW
ncbi:hypothetical protein [Flavobacterium polysaccharolyticum]|uniref:Head domain of trimeric autotransporter adhesin n=1 Tax=Flavobacterium polysaccharolyticum TaxID=3133148 RepID=A0ABU9NII4_9FLAO